MTSHHDSYQRSLHDFDQALLLLDHELSSLRRHEPLPIRALGGYALLKHGIRTGSDSTTVDIDTMTVTYDAEVRHAIHVVATQCHMDVDWLTRRALCTSRWMGGTILGVFAMSYPG